MQTVYLTVPILARYSRMGLRVKYEKDDEGIDSYSSVPILAHTRSDAMATIGDEEAERLDDFPRALEHMTLDEAAECLPVSRETSRALWSLMPADKDIPPQGEWPEPDSPDRQARSLQKFWRDLSLKEQADILEAARKDGRLQ